MVQVPGSLITHPNGQVTHYIEENFTNPWEHCETVLIQHGFGRHASFWYHWIPAIAGNYRVIRRDARGHGYSSFPNSKSSYAYTIDTICEEIIDTLDQLEIDKVHFLGESTSGMVGEILAARYPSRLLSLTICSSPTYLPPTALSLFAFGFDDWPTACRQLGSRGWAEKLSQVPGTVGSADAAYVKWWKDQMAVSSGEGLAGYAEFLSTLDARPFLSQIRVPMLILAPANSVATSVEDQKKIQEQVAGSRLVVVDGAGHEIYNDKAAVCQDALLSFLRELREARE